MPELPLSIVLPPSLPLSLSALQLSACSVSETSPLGRDGALPPKLTRKQPGEPPKMGAHGVGGGLEARAGTAPTLPFNPSPAALRRRNARASPPVSAMATSQGLYATLQGQQEQRGAGAPSSKRQWVPRSAPHRNTPNPAGIEGAREVCK